MTTGGDINKALLNFNPEAAAKMGDLVDGAVHKLTDGQIRAALEAANKQQYESPTKVEARIQVVNIGPEVGPNKPCPCGSGKKNKKCCRVHRQTKEITHRRIVVLDPEVARALKKAKKQGKRIEMNQGK